MRRPIAMLVDKTVAATCCQHIVLRYREKGVSQTKQQAFLKNKAKQGMQYGGHSSTPSAPSAWVTSLASCPQARFRTVQRGPTMATSLGPFSSCTMPRRDVACSPSRFLALLPAMAAVRMLLIVEGSCRRSMRMRTKPYCSRQSLLSAPRICSSSSA